MIEDLFPGKPVYDNRAGLPAVVESAANGMAVLRHPRRADPWESAVEDLTEPDHFALAALRSASE